MDDISSCLSAGKLVIYDPSVRFRGDSDRIYRCMHVQSRSRVGQVDRGLESEEEGGSATRSVRLSDARPLLARDEARAS